MDASEAMRLEIEKMQKQYQELKRIEQQAAAEKKQQAEEERKRREAELTVEEAAAIERWRKAKKMQEALDAKAAKAQEEAGKDRMRQGAKILGK
jgi:hypothetical protein